MNTRTLLFLLAALLAEAQGEGACTNPVSTMKLQTLEEMLGEVPGVECRRQLAVVLEGIRNLTDWALQMADATAKVPSGLLRGNLRALGDMDECVAVEAETHNTTLRGKYCLASVHIDSDNAVVTHLLDIAMGGRRNLEYRHRMVDVGNGKPEPGFVFTPEFTRGELGVCVPAACAAADVEAALGGAARRLLAGTALSADVRVSQHACRTRHGPSRPLAAAHYAFASICGVLALFIVTGTIWDIYYANTNDCTSTSHAMLHAFAIRTNWKRLTSDRGQEISCIDGIRVLFSGCAVLYHQSLYLISESVLDKTTIAHMSQSIYFMPLYTGLVLNDALFTFRGVLISYTLGDKLKRGNLKYIPELLNRFYRLAPIYYLIIWFCTTFLEYLGDGPGWEIFVQYNAEICRKNWIYNVLYVNNFINTLHICMLQSWFLSVDMQLFILALLLLVPLYRWPRGREIVLALIALSMGLQAATIIVQRTPAIFRLYEKDIALQRLIFNVHVAPHAHSSPFLVGLFCGYILNTVKKQNLSINKVSVVIGWSAFVIMMIYILFGPYHMMLVNYKYNAFDSAVYSSLSRLFMGMAMSWLVFACHKGYGGWINIFLSCYPFRVLSRLTYAANLSHFVLLIHSSGRRRVPLWTDLYFNVQIFTANFVMVMVLSAILYLCVESPFCLVKEWFLPKSSSKNIQENGYPCQRLENKDVIEK